MDTGHYRQGREKIILSERLSGLCQKKNEEHVQTDNIMMCLRAVRVAGDINCRLFISSGTVAEYALWNGIMDLSRKQTPNDMYGAAKAAVYYLLEVKARQIGIPLIWSIIPSTFGERRADNSIITSMYNM